MFNEVADDRTCHGVRTYCDDDVVRSADGEWQIGDADDWCRNAAVDVCMYVYVYVCAN